MFDRTSLTQWDVLSVMGIISDMKKCIWTYVVVFCQWLLETTQYFTVQKSSLIFNNIDLLDIFCIICNDEKRHVQFNEL